MRLQCIKREPHVINLNGENEDLKWSLRNEFFFYKNVLR